MITQLATASLTFVIRQSGALKLLLFQPGYRKFFDLETPGVWRPKNPGFRGWKMSGVPSSLGFGEPRGGNPIHKHSTPAVICNTVISEDQMYLSLSNKKYFRLWPILITPHSLFSPIFLQSCSVIHESGSDHNPFQRYGHSKFSNSIWSNRK